MKYHVRPGWFWLSFFSYSNQVRFSGAGSVLPVLVMGFRFIMYVVNCMIVSHVMVHVKPDLLCIYVEIFVFIGMLLILTGLYLLRIRPGSSLLFNKCLILEVQDVRHYASFLEMLEGECLDKILPGVENIQEGLQIYRNFYTEEKERLNGVLAICLSRPVSQPYIALAEIISGLGYEGNQSLLGLKHTAGTIADALPPSRSALLLSFTAQHKPNGVTRQKELGLWLSMQLEAAVFIGGHLEEVILPKIGMQWRS